VTTGALQVVTGVLSVDGSTFTINCLAPFSLRQSSFASKLAATTKLAATASQRLETRAVENLSDVELASRFLLAPIRGELRATRVIGPSTSVSVNPDTQLRFEEQLCGFDYGIACTTAKLTSTITASPGAPVVIDISMLYHDYRVYSLSELFYFNYYGGPDCANASETWLALNAAMQQMEEEINQMEAATNEVAALTCESRFTDDGQNLCIDLFIMGERAAFLAGDNREHDPNAPFKASRAQLYINPNACTVEAVVNTTRTATFGSLDNVELYPHVLNKVHASPDASGNCVVTWKLWNGFCQAAGINIIFCPAIDGKMTLRPSGGGYTGNIEEDQFPSRGLYKWNGSGWTTISERTETILLDLALRRKSKEKLQIERDKAIPPGCNLQ
jgi:hypothetical protein